MTSHVLYYYPNVCSLVPQIALRELDLPFELVRVDIRAHTLADGAPLSTITPKQYVPALRLPDGEVLTETAVILLYLAELRPEANLAPRSGFAHPEGTGSPGSSLARVRFHELLHFIATEFHKGFAPFTIMASPSEASRAWSAARLARRADILDDRLGDAPYLGGDAPTVADFYAFWALTTYARLTRNALPARLAGLVERLAARPSVIASLAAERA